MVCLVFTWANKMMMMMMMMLSSPPVGRCRQRIRRQPAERGDPRAAGRRDSCCIPRWRWARRAANRRRCRTGRCWWPETDARSDRRASAAAALSCVASSTCRPAVCALRRSRRADLLSEIRRSATASRGCQSSFVLHCKCQERGPYSRGSVGEMLVWRELSK